MSKKAKRKVTTAKNTDNGNNLRPLEEKTFVSTRVMTDSDFNPDYSSIKKDLKRIGVLAITFFVVLVALSFFL